MARGAGVGSGMRGRECYALIIARDKMACQFYPSAHSDRIPSDTASRSSVSLSYAACGAQVTGVFVSGEITWWTRQAGYQIIIMQISL